MNSNWKKEYEKKASQKKMKRKISIWGISFSGAAIISILVYMAILSVGLNQNCLGHLKRAADASTIETSELELGIALDYLEKENLTSGYTSVLWETPDEDIKFWYENIKSAKNELDSLPKNSSNMEKSNMLIKLRETLLDHGGKGSESITCPDGLSRYPNNSIFALSLLGSLIILGFFSGKLISNLDL